MGLAGISLWLDRGFLSDAAGMRLSVAVSLSLAALCVLERVIVVGR
jgi:hypothetical protein